MRAARGFSLVELMIALTLGLLVTEAIVSMFNASRQTSGTTNAVAAVGDNGRFAMSLVEQAVRSGGYMACNAINNLHTVPGAGNPTTRQSSVLPGQPATIWPILNNYTQALGGFEAAGSAPGSALVVAPPPVAADASTADWINPGGLDTLLTKAPSPGVVKGSDVLVVRQVLGQTPLLFTSAAYNPGAGLLSVSMSPSSALATLAAGQNAVLSNCVYSVAFQITAVSGTTVSINANLGEEFDPPSLMALVDTAVFFIGPGRDGDSSLWVYHDSTGAFLELVPDVENMQVLYGVASTTPSTVTQYVTSNNLPAAATDFNGVVSVKVALLVASPPGQNALAVPAAAPKYSLLGTTVTAPLDNRLRRVVSATVTSRNAAN
jgi:type IV pilus assembly protein PilW